MLQIASFNCNSIRKNVDSVRSLLKNNDFVVLQELLICESDVNFLSTLDSNVQYHAFVKDKHLNGINTGRPCKGVAIFWKKYISSVTTININEWINGVTFQTDIGVVLLLNVYLPCDLGNNDSLHDYRNALAVLSTVIDEYNVNNVLVIGDLNADPHKGRFWVELGVLIDDHGLKSEVGFLSPEDFTFLSPSHNTTSYIDHVLCNVNMYEKLQNVAVNYNLSLYDHFPLEVTFNLKVCNKTCPNTIKTDFFVDWNNLTDNDLLSYRRNIDSQLMQWCNHPVFTCNGSSCPEHKQDINLFYEFLIETLKGSSNHMTIIRKSFPKCIPGWNDLVKDKYKFASQNFLKWKDAGKPLHGPSFDNMKKLESWF